MQKNQLKMVGKLQDLTKCKGMSEIDTKLLGVVEIEIVPCFCDFLPELSAPVLDGSFFHLHHLLILLGVPPSFYSCFTQRLGNLIHPLFSTSELGIYVSSRNLTEFSTGTPKSEIFNGEWCITLTIKRATTIHSLGSPCHKQDWLKGAQDGPTFGLMLCSPRLGTWAENLTFSFCSRPHKLRIRPYLGVILDPPK